MSDHDHHVNDDLIVHDYNVNDHTAPDLQAGGSVLRLDRWDVCGSKWHRSPERRA
jgi:hypothetical protein